MTYAKYPGPSKLAAHWLSLDASDGAGNGAFVVDTKLYPLDLWGDNTDDLTLSPQPFQNIRECVVEGILIDTIVNAATIKLFKSSDEATAIITITLETGTGPLPLYIPFGDPGIKLNEPFGGEVSSGIVEAHVFYRIISTT